MDDFGEPGESTREVDGTRVIEHDLPICADCFISRNPTAGFPVSHNEPPRTCVHCGGTTTHGLVT